MDDEARGSGVPILVRHRTPWRPPPEHIEELERAIGVALPQELRRALTLRDGGTSSYSSYRRDSRCVPLPAFLGVADIRRSEQHRERFGTPAGILVIASGTHEWLGLDYRHGTTPRIVFQESEDSALEEVAESFESLLDGLQVD